MVELLGVCNRVVWLYCSICPLNVSQIGKWFDEVVTGGILDERLFRLLLLCVLRTVTRKVWDFDSRVSLDLYFLE